MQIANLDMSVWRICWWPVAAAGEEVGRRQGQCRRRRILSGEATPDSCKELLGRRATCSLACSCSPLVPGDGAARPTATAAHRAPPWCPTCPPTPPPVSPPHPPPTGDDVPIHHRPHLVPDPDQWCPPPCLPRGRRRPSTATSWRSGRPDAWPPASPRLDARGGARSSGRA